MLIFCVFKKMITNYANYDLKILNATIDFEKAFKNSLKIVFPNNRLL